MTRGVFLFFIALMLGACEGNDQALSFAPVVETARLENGMEIIVIPDRRAGVITHMVWYKVGAIDEPPMKSGLAHFFEHMMFRGTANDPDGSFDKKITRIGGQNNAFTSYDFTAYFQRVARDHLAQVMRLEADRMRNLIIDETRFAIEQNVVLEERALRVDSNARAAFEEAMRARLNQGGAYGVPVIGWREEIAALSADDARGFYDAHYLPSNAVLVVSGDTDLQEVLPLAREIYGVVEAGERKSGEVLAPVLAGAVDAEPLMVQDARVTQAFWQRLYRLPHLRAAADKKTIAALDVLAQMLAGSANAPFYRRLVFEEALASDVSVFSDSTRRGNALFQISVDAEGADGFARIADIIDAELDLVRAGKIDDDALARAKFQLRAQAIYALDSGQALAYGFGQAATLGVSPALVIASIDEIAQVEADALVEVARDLLRDDVSLVGGLYP